MADYRFLPKEFLERPDWFGRRLDGKWKTVQHDSVEWSYLAAAYYQHLASHEAQRIADEQRLTLDDLADALHTSRSTLRRKFNGESPARLDEILAWAKLLGIEVLPEPSDTDDLAPGPFR